MLSLKPPLRAFKSNHEMKLYSNYIYEVENKYNKVISGENTQDDYVDFINCKYKEYENCITLENIQYDEKLFLRKLKTYTFFNMLDENDKDEFISLLSENERHDIFKTNSIKLSVWFDTVEKIKNKRKTYKIYVDIYESCGAFIRKKYDRITCMWYIHKNIDDDKFYWPWEKMPEQYKCIYVNVEDKILTNIGNKYIDTCYRKDRAGIPNIKEIYIK